MIGESLKRYRKETGLTQKELADKLNSSQNTISQYESGKRTPTVKKLLAISILLGCSVDELMTGHSATDRAGTADTNEEG